MQAVDTVSSQADGEIILRRCPFRDTLFREGRIVKHSTLQTHATQMAPAARGTAMAVFAGCLFLGQSVGVGLGGLALPLTGSTGVLVGAGVWLAVLGLAFARRLRQWQDGLLQEGIIPHSKQETG